MENDVINTLRLEGFGFKKRLGQNFITDKNLLASIVRGAGVTAEDSVVEIGCGAGTLTRAIAEKAKRVVGFEVDKDLKPVLARTLSGYDNAEIRFCDFLKADLGALERELGDYSVVANIPYYVTTPLIMKILGESARCKSITVTVQEEVADRLCAKPGTPDYGAITAAVALRASAEIIKKIPREMFIPRPNVDSAAVKLVIEDGRLPVKDPAMYKKVVRAAFSSRRKTLENNLVNCFKLTRSEVKNLLSECGIPTQARGETLSPGQFAALSDLLARNGSVRDLHKNP